MSLIKKIDVDNHFAERRARRLGRMPLMSHPGAARMKPAASAKRAPAFKRDFVLEHSSPTVTATSIPIASDAGPSRLLRRPGSREV
jgi:hypothetical protein